MSAVMETGEAVFRPRARMIKLVGEQLIRNETLAVLELVKNAYDADATACYVRVISGTTPSGFVEIEDNGRGMSLETILTSWMEPATDIKLRQKVSPKGRRVQGEKGVGRFAADKIGHTLTLISKTEESPDEIVVGVDWDDFESAAAFLQDVKVDWERREPSRIKISGTILRMERLRTIWDDPLLFKLRAALERLMLALVKKMDFQVFLEANEFPDYSGELEAREPPPPQYQVKAEVDGEGNLRVLIGGKQRKLDVLTPKFTKCGPLSIELNAWDLDENLLRSLPDLSITKARRLIKSWSGVAIYLDGFRVYPYGEPGVDWLDLDQRRINRPAARFSNSQVMGTIRISKDSNPDLIQQTNREGLIQNRAFEEMRNVTLKVVGELENYRLERKGGREVRPTGGRVALDRTQLLQLKTYVETSQRLDRQELTTFINEALVATDKSEEVVLKEIARYRRLATLGTLAAALVHEVEQHVDSIRRTASTQKERIDMGFVTDPRILRQAFDRIDTSAALLNKVASMWQPFIRARPRPQFIDLMDVTANAVESRRRDIDGNKVKVKIGPEPPTPLKLKADPADILQIVVNLLDNSLYWLKGRPSPEVRITVKEQDKLVEILFSDNGPGIPEENADFIFIPFWSTKPEGSGLGLTIVGETVADMGGTISLVESELDHGTSFRIRIPTEES